MDLSITHNILIFVSVETKLRLCYRCCYALFYKRLEKGVFEILRPQPSISSEERLSSVQVTYDYEADRSVLVPEEFRRQVGAFEGRSFSAG